MPDKKPVFNGITLCQDHSLPKEAFRDPLQSRNNLFFPIGCKTGLANFFGINKNTLKKNYPKDWSILICTLEERKEQFKRIYTKLQNQIKANKLEDKVEILYFCDNREFSVGHKRNVLLKESKGLYVCFIDDDDNVHDQYIEIIHDKLKNNPDCVSLWGIYTVNHKNPRLFTHSIKYKTYFESNNIFYRPPNHLNPIRRSIAIQFPFPEISYGEDTNWAMQIARSGLIKTEEEIQTPYYFYEYIPK